MNDFDYNRVFWILEYQTIDSLGRGKEWLYAGLARTEDEIETKKTEIEASLKGKNFAFRSHRYSHALGTNA